MDEMDNKLIYWPLKHLFPLLHNVIDLYHFQKNVHSIMVTADGVFCRWCFAKFTVEMNTEHAFSCLN